MRTTGLFAGPILGVLMWILNPGDHAPSARNLLGILVLAIVWWMTEAIPLPATALLASALCIVTGVASAADVLAPYANPIIFLFIGTFLLAEAFARHGLDRRVAGFLLRRPGTGRSPAGLMTGFGGASAAISCLISNTATSALFTPVAVGAIRRRGGCTDDADGRTHARPWATGVLLMVAYGSTVGGMATLVGTPPNLLVAGFLDELTGVRISFTGWLIFGVPISLVMLAISLLWTRSAMRDAAGFAHPDVPEAPRPEADDPDAAVRRRRGARWTILAFGLAGTLWILPGATGMILGRGHPLARMLTDHLPEAGVALLCAAILFVLPVSWRARRFTLTWSDAQRVNWGIILLFGGGLSLGTLAQSTGLALWAAEGIRSLGLADTPAGLLAVSIATAILVSEFASNTASTTLLVPIVIATAQASGFDPVRPTIAVGLAATCGFIFPVSTPPNAIVFGTGLVPLWRMIRVGILLDLTAFVLIWGALMVMGPLLPR